MLASFDTVVASGISCASAAAYPASGILVEQYARYSFQVVFNYAGAASGNATGTCTVKGANTNTSFCNLASSGTYSSGTSCSLFEITSKAHRYAQIAFGSVAGTGGTATVYFHGEYDKD